MCARARAGARGQVTAVTCPSSGLRFVTLVTVSILASTIMKTLQVVHADASVKGRLCISLRGLYEMAKTNPSPKRTGIDLISVVIIC